MNIKQIPSIIGLFLLAGVIHSSAAVTTWTWAAGIADNWSVTTRWTAAGSPTGAGNIVQQTSNLASPSAPITTNNVTATIGQVKNTPASGRIWTIENDGVHSLTMDNTGGSANLFAVANSALEYSSSGNLNVNTPLIIQNTDLDIGATGSGAANMTIGVSANSVSITATSARTLNFKDNGTHQISVNDSIAGSGSTISIKNVGTSTGSVWLFGTVGPNANVTQNSTTSLLGLQNSLNSYTGSTTITAGTLQLGAANSIPSVSSVSLTGVLNLAGFSDAIDGLAGAGLVTNSTATAVTLSVGNNNSGGTFSGVIGTSSAGTINLTKAGNGTEVLSGANIYAGTTIINGGALNAGVAENAGVAGPFGKATTVGSIVFGGGTLQYSAANTYDYSSRFSTSANQAISIDTAGQWQTDGVALLVDADDVLTLFTNDEMTAIVLFLCTIIVIGDEFRHLFFLDAVEQLRNQTRRLFVSVLIRRGILTTGVALALFLFHQFIEDPFRVVEVHRHICFGAGVQSRAAPTIREVDGEAFTSRLNGALVNFVTAAFAEIQRDVREFGECLHFLFLVDG